MFATLFLLLAALLVRLITIDGQVVAVIDFDGPAGSRNPAPAPAGCIAGRELKVTGDRGDTWTDNHERLARKGRKRGNLIHISVHAAQVYLDSTGRVVWSRPISIGRVYSCPPEVLEQLTAEEGGD